MKKLFLLLLLFGLAWGSQNVMAHLAPTIYDLPSPVVGQYKDTTGTVSFVFPDALDLRRAVDLLGYYPTTPTFMWGYETVGTPKYMINGVPPVNSFTDSLINIPDNRNINKTVTGGELNPDHQASTLTIRNVHLSPLGGPTTTPTQTGIIDPQAVTFWCSDGTALSSSTIMFYTDARGSSRLSGPANAWHVNYVDDLTRSWSTSDPMFGSVTTSTWLATGKGLCFNVPGPGDNVGSASSRYQPFTLTANTVYRIRATMNCSQATVGKTPFWDFIVENYGTQGGVTRGMNLYGMDTFFLDNEGGANSVITTQNGTEFQMIWAPIAFNTRQWNDTTNGIYATKYQANRDPYLRFRVLDAVSCPGLQNDQKFGSLCLQQVVVESIPYSRFVEDSTLYNVQSPRGANNTDKLGNMCAYSLIGSSIRYLNNMVLEIKPGNNYSQMAELVTVCPAVDLNGAGGDNITSPYTQIADDWPILWQSGKIYKLEVGLVAPDPNSESHPYDAIWLNMEPPTWEVAAESFVTSTNGIASPKVGLTQTYTLFYYSMNETKSPIQALHYLRWRIRFGNSPSLNFPQPTDLANSGGVRVTGVRVAQVHVQ